MRRLKATLAALTFSFCAAGATAAGGAAVTARHGDCASGAFSVDDYFGIKRVVELALSDDGRRLLYAVESHAGAGRRRDVYLTPLTDGSVRQLAGELADARAFTWIPGSHELAFLLQRGPATQVVSWRPARGETRQVTRAADSVQTFRYAPDGRTLAFATRASAEPGLSLYEQFRNGREGILIDPATTSSHDFLNPHWHQLSKPSPLVLWVQRDGEASQVPVPGEVAAGEQGYFWSEDGRHLSVTFIPDDVPDTQMRPERTSLGVFELETGDFQVIARGRAPRDGEPAIAYRGGEWIPGEHRLLLRRVLERDPWVSGAFPDWAVVDAARPLARQQAAWRPVEVYPRGLEFRPLSASKILVSNTVRGVHSLFLLTSDGIERSEVVAELDGSSTRFRFDARREVVVFVHENLRQPPEIYVHRQGEVARRLTALNESIARKLRYTRREVRWESTDGTEVSGWLLEPQGSRPAPGWPMITHVHGGPAFPFPDAFAPYFSYWPYPLESYPAHGIAVFLPNYRGTHTYGRRIAGGGRDEPIHDIVSGVEHLVSGKVADPSRLGISGHSHGALVGPLAMVRSRMFAASSFAEGVSNSVVMYELMSGDANREIHDAVMGASLYDAPALYLAESADLQMAGVETASLFEAGAHMTALYMLGFAKAAERFGVPAEFIVYPQTGHNIVNPALQRESAQRNLDWFRFWLQGCAATGPNHGERYRRWRALGRR